jgi:dipeptidyl-peptidase 4
MNGRLLIVALVFSTWTVPPSIAQEKPDDSLLTVERIFGRHEFEAESPGVRWLPDGSGYTMMEGSKESSGGQDLVQYDAATGKREILVPAAHLVPPRESAPLPVHGYSLSDDRSKLLIFTNSKRVWRQNTRGDYWVLDRASRELRKLGGDAPAASLMFAKLAPVGSLVAFVRANNLYVEDLHDGRMIRLTNSQSPDEINGSFDWVYEEEFSLRDGYRWSPDGKSIAYWQLNTEGVREYPLVNNTDSLYPRITPVKYPKVGEQNAICRVGVVSAAGGKTKWLTNPDRDNYIAYMEWAGNSKQILLQSLNRLQNTDRLTLSEIQSESSTGPESTRADSVLITSGLAFNVDSLPPLVPFDPSAKLMPTREILTEHDDAWLDLQDELLWTRDHQEFLWLSERDGWRHIYRVDRTGKAPALVTPGDFDVIQLLEIDQRSGHVYFIASPDNPTQKYLYRVRLDGTGRERVTPKDQPGTHDYQISPSAKWAVHRYSNFDTPPTTELIRLPGHERVRLLADNAALKKKLESLKKIKTEFFRVDIGDGIALDAWCIRRADLDPAAKYPLLVHVYGEPAGQTVLDSWGGGNTLFHRMLAQEGYIVMSFDNRGTPSPRGRAWRKAVNRKIGIIAPQEQAAAVKAVLQKRPYIDPHRIGVWGWSGGGSMSLNAIFKFPDLYAMAIAIAPVANQRYYDTIYQERYMGLPGDNVDGFTQGSPINFAHQLKGNLLLIHGTGDDNCHYQGTEALINELIRHDKPFTMMAYPNRSHAINEGQNTTLHLRQLMTRYLTENLPPGPIPAKGQTGGKLSENRDH